MSAVDIKSILRNGIKVNSPGKEPFFQYPVSLVEQIAQFLTNAIIEGELEGGHRLVENDLREKFGTSRAPIRESFRILEKKGLVVIIPRKGAFVRKITHKDILEIFPVRACLEGLAARQAIPNFTPTDIEQMDLALYEMGEAEKSDFKSYLRCHSKFHEIFIYASRNDILVAILENLRHQSMWFRFLYLYVRENYKYELRIHEEILDLFVKKDADRVEALVKEHILNSLDRFLQFLPPTDDRGLER